MELPKGVEIKLEEGKIKLEVAVVALLLAPIEAKVASGEIDLVKGTDLDKDVLLKAIGFIKAQLGA